MSRRSCLVCGAPDAHEHHALPKSVWPQHRDNPDVLTPLCPPCHGAWHDGLAPVHRELLPPGTLALILNNASAGWIDAWYPARNTPTPY